MFHLICSVLASELGQKIHLIVLLMLQYFDYWSNLLVIDAARQERDWFWFVVLLLTFFASGFQQARYAAKSIQSTSCWRHFAIIMDLGGLGNLVEAIPALWYHERAARRRCGTDFIPGKL